MSNTTCAASGAALLFAALATPVQSAEAGSDAAAPSDQLETVIVTAQKRSEDVQSVPFSISVIGSDALENLHATQLSDYAGYIPGMQLTNAGGPGQGQVSLRGIPALGSSGTVAFYIDDTPLTSSSLYGAAATTTLDLLPYDFDNVQVLRGPQGTLWGASALGGLVSYTTKLPNLEVYSAQVGVDAEHIDGAGKLGYGGRLRVNLPLIPGQLAMSASVSRENSPGYIDNVTTGARDQNAFSQQAARVALLWKPNDAVTAKVSAMQQRIDSSSADFVMLAPNPADPLSAPTRTVALYGRLRDDNFLPERFDSTLNYFSAELDWDLHFANLVSATSYSQNQSRAAIDATLTYGVLWGGLSSFLQDFDLDKVTQEFRLSSKPAEHFEWMAGLFYTNERSRQTQVVRAYDADGKPNVYDPAAIAALPSSYREYAGFGELTYKLNAALDVTGGLRWAKNIQAFEQISGGILLPTAVVPGHSSEGVWTYSVSPRWHIDPDNMLYFRVASGYQAGGPNVFLEGVPASVGADTVTNYELGVKSTVWDHRLQVDADAFYIKWNKIQVSQSNGTASYIVNGGTARSEGFEFSSKLKATQQLELAINATWTEALLTEDIPGIGGEADDNLPFIPRWAASATANYTIPLGGEWDARLGGGIRYNGRSVTTVTHSPLAVPLDSYTAVDLNASIEDRHWTLRVFVKNAANREVYTNAIPILSAATGGVPEVRGVPLQPRTVGLAADFKF